MPPISLVEPWKVLGRKADLSVLGPSNHHSINASPLKSFCGENNQRFPRLFWPLPSLKLNFPYWHVWVWICMSTPSLCIVCVRGVYGWARPMFCYSLDSVFIKACVLEKLLLSGKQEQYSEAERGSLASRKYAKGPRWSHRACDTRNRTRSGSY